MWTRTPGTTGTMETSYVTNPSCLTSDSSPRMLTRRWFVSRPAVTNYYYLINGTFYLLMESLMDLDTSDTATLTTGDG